MNSAVDEDAVLACCSCTHHTLCFERWLASKYLEHYTYTEKCGSDMKLCTLDRAVQSRTANAPYIRLHPTALLTMLQACWVSSPQDQMHRVPHQHSAHHQMDSATPLQRSVSNAVLK